MQLSARNQLKGTISAVDRGPISARVLIDVGGGNVLSATITCSAAEDLGLAVGDAVTAIIKSSDVIVGK